MPSLCCRMQAVDGNTMSGVEVATMIRSMSCGVAAGGLERAARAASSARSLQVTPASAKWRARMPVRSTIQSSEVSMPSRGQSRRQVGIGHAARRQVAAGAGDARVAERGCALMRLTVASDVSAALAAGWHAPASLPACRRMRSCTRSSSVAGRIISPIQRLLEGEGIGRAMALEHQAAQAEQRRAVVAAVVDAALEAVQHRQRHQRRQLGAAGCA